MRLNLGANNRRFPGFVSVDICEPADQLVDLAGPWPWEDSSVDEVLAYDVFEHIGNCNHTGSWACQQCDPRALFGLPFRHWSGKVHVMNELWRVLKPGARATLQIPHATLGDGGHCDPTHVSYWTTSDFEYYTPGIAERERFRSSSYYDVKSDFRVVNLTVPGAKNCVVCANETASKTCRGGHIPTRRCERTFGGYVVEMQPILEAVKP